MATGLAGAIISSLISTFSNPIVPPSQETAEIPHRHHNLAPALNHILLPLPREPDHLATMAPILLDRVFHDAALPVIPGHRGVLLRVHAPDQGKHGYGDSGGDRAALQLWSGKCLSNARAWLRLCYSRKSRGLMWSCAWSLMSVAILERLWRWG